MDICIPGMLNSARELINLAISNEKKVLTKPAYLGNCASAIIITAQCIELLLKYNIQLEGQKIKKIHHLSRLFRTLSKPAQQDIQDKFEEITASFSKPLPSGWDNIRSVLKKTDNALIEWRYLVEKNNIQKENRPMIFYSAALSICHNILKYDQQFVLHEITDETIKLAFEFKE